MKIITAKDYLVRNRARTVRERIKMLSGQMYQRGVMDVPSQDAAPTGSPVIAEVNHGQWLAMCECSGAEAVDYDEPIFYCFNCGNRSTGGRPRPVIFPEPALRYEIETLLLARPVDDRMGTNAIDRAFMAKPIAVGVVDGNLLGLERSWKNSESVDDLRQQNLLIENLTEQYQATNRGEL